MGITDRLAGLFPCTDTLFQRSVVELLVRAQQNAQRLCLSRRWVKAVIHLAFLRFSLHDLVAIPKTELRSLYHYVYALQYHLVIVTKCRKKCLTDTHAGVVREAGQGAL